MCECCIQPPAQLSSTCSARGGELGGVPRLISSSKKEPGNEAGNGEPGYITVALFPGLPTIQQLQVGRSWNEANIEKYS